MAGHAAILTPGVRWAALALAASACAPGSGSGSGGAPGHPNPSHAAVVTLFGGLDRERVQGVSVLSNGNIVVAGETTSDFAILPQFDQTLAPPFDASLDPNPESDGYVAVLDPSLTRILYWTYLGGSGADRAYFATEDGAGHIWVCGFTGSHPGMAAPFP